MITLTSLSSITITSIVFNQLCQSIFLSSMALAKSRPLRLAFLEQTLFPRTTTRSSTSSILDITLLPPPRLRLSSALVNEFKLPVVISSLTSPRLMKMAIVALKSTINPSHGLMRDLAALQRQTMTPMVRSMSLVTISVPTTRALCGSGPTCITLRAMTRRPSLFRLL